MNCSKMEEPVSGRLSEKLSLCSSDGKEDISKWYKRKKYYNSYINTNMKIICSVVEHINTQSMLHESYRDIIDNRAGEQPAVHKSDKT